MVGVFLFSGGMGSLSAKIPTHVSGPQKHDYWQLWFFLEHHSSDYESEWIFRPLLPVYTRYRNQERDSHYDTFLYPFYYNSGTRFWRRSSFMEFFATDSKYHEDTGRDTDLLFPPFIFYGYGDSESESYGGLFPFYGEWRDNLSWQSMTYVMWPVYLNWTYRQYRAHSLFWPILMWGGSPRRSDFRLLFVYSQKVHRGKYDRRTLLWPFLQWGREGMDATEPRNFFFFWPFYGRKWSDHGNMEATVVLWPFFAWGHDRVRGSESLRLFWFLYQRERSRDPYVKKDFVMPFYGRYRFGSKEEKYWKSMDFITPLYLTLELQSGSVRAKDTYYGVFLYQDLNTHYLTTGVRENHTRLWPLFHSTRSSDGYTSFSTLSLWFFRSELTDRYWAPLLSGQLLEYRDYRSGDNYLSFLLRSVSIQWSEDSTDLFLAGWGYHDAPDGEWSVELLGGLFGFGRRPVAESMNRGGPAASTSQTESVFQLLWFEI